MSAFARAIGRLAGSYHAVDLDDVARLAVEGDNCAAEARGKAQELIDRIRLVDVPPMLAGLPLRPSLLNALRGGRLEGGSSS